MVRKSAHKTSTLTFWNGFDWQIVEIFQFSHCFNKKIGNVVKSKKKSNFSPIAYHLKLDADTLCSYIRCLYIHYWMVHLCMRRWKCQTNGDYGGRCLNSINSQHEFQAVCICYGQMVMCFTHIWLAICFQQFLPSSESAGQTVHSLLSYWPLTLLMLMLLLLLLSVVFNFLAVINVNRSVNFRCTLVYTMLFIFSSNTHIHRHAYSTGAV